MAYDVGGRGDQSFNDSAAAGLDKAVEELGVEPAGGRGRPTVRPRRLARSACAARRRRLQPVVAVGFAYAASVGKVAPEYPDVKFAIIDDDVAATGESRTSPDLIFAEEQGSFLVGAAAALKTKAGHIGFVGGVEVPLIKKFEAGYKAGAKAVNPDIKVDVKYLTQPPDFSGFDDPAKGKTAAEGMYTGGADIVYHAAGGSGGGVFEAAAEAGEGNWRSASTPTSTRRPPRRSRAVIMTSMLKKVDVAVYDFIKACRRRRVAGRRRTSTTWQVDGVGYSTTGGRSTTSRPSSTTTRQQIIDGEIEVPTTP